MSRPLSTRLLWLATLLPASIASADLVHVFDAASPANLLDADALVQWTDIGSGRDYGSGTVMIDLNRAEQIFLTSNFASPGTLLTASFLSDGSNTSGAKPENEPQSASIGNGLTDATFEVWFRADLEDTERPDWQVIWESGATTNGFALLLSTNGIFDAELRVIKAFDNLKIADITIPLTGFASGDFIQAVVTFDGDSTADNDDAVKLHARDAVGTSATGEDPTNDFASIAGSDDSCAFNAANQTTFGVYGAAGGNVGNAIALSGFAGEIALIRVYDSVLAPAEIDAAYAAIADTGDDDADGMPNVWEELNGLDKADPADAGLDTDEDGLDNLAEFGTRTDPRNADTDGDGLSDGGEASAGSDPLAPDTDGDGLSDGDEVAADPFVTSPILADSDDDGASDSIELMVGTDPTSAADFPHSVLISEFMASNGFTLDDEDGDASDWIEILNPTPAAISIGGMYLTDDAATLQKWRVPAGVTLAPGEFLIVFASGKDRAANGAPLHTNFSLDSGGEYLGLIAADGLTPVTEFAPVFPEQKSDVSFAFSGFYLTRPSPCGANTGPAVTGFVEDTTFTVDRGFYDTPFVVEIASATPGATIVYTTDSSTPSLENGIQAGGSLASVAIARTTVLRAAAYKEGLAATNVDTHTYLFPDDVIVQSDDPNDYEYSNWDNLDQPRAADYGMDTTDIVGTLFAPQEVKDSLASLPTISMATDAARLFDRETGNYANSKKTGQAWEREVSLEFFGFPGGAEKQINGGLRLAGNASRSPDRNKHNMRVAFRRQYGDGVLEFPLFPGSPVTTFDSIQLRGGNGDSWINGGVRDRATYLRDQWHREVLGAMQQPTQPQIFAHLYINGWYWGVYHIFERIEDDFMTYHYGGEYADWDVRDHVAAFDGNNDSWNAAFAIADDPATLADPQKYANLQTYVDPSHLADYLLLHFYSNSDDWDQNNFRAAYSRSIPNTYRFFAWDQERSLLNSLATPDVNGAIAIDKDTNTSTKKGPTHFHQRLRANPEYRLLFADRVRRHCFHGGPLTPEGASAIWDRLADELRPAMIAESARWGDWRGTAKTPADWEARVALEKSGWFDIRTPILIELLKARGLYPQAVAPDYRINGSPQHGGQVARGASLSLVGGGGLLFYTLDGSDPRTPESGAAAGTVYTTPVTLTQSVTVKSRALDLGEWSALTEARFFVGTSASAENLVVSEIMYHPAGTGDAEFLELTNISPTDAIDLTDCRFTAGIDFVFPDNTTLEPGQRVLVVRSIAAFESVHGSNHPVAGEFAAATALDDAGERITLTDANGAPIRDFAYDDKGAWPRGADGEGFSLVLIDPTSNPDHAAPENWRTSVGAGGSPDASDSTTFADWAAARGITDPLADSDANGIPALLEYLLVTTAGAPSPLPLPYPIVESRQDDSYLTLRVTLAPGADDAEVSAEVSADLIDWSDASDKVIRTRNDRSAGSAGDELTFESAIPLSVEPRQFLRLRATLR